jgi:sulfatase maturation enzyme AslB (radical SAM superfamily)
MKKFFLLLGFFVFFSCSNEHRDLPSEIISGFRKMLLSEKKWKLILKQQIQLAEKTLRLDTVYVVSDSSFASMQSTHKEWKNNFLEFKKICEQNKSMLSLKEQEQLDSIQVFYSTHIFPLSEDLMLRKITVKNFENLLVKIGLLDKASEHVKSLCSK